MTVLEAEIYSFMIEAEKKEHGDKDSYSLVESDTSMA